MPVRGNDALVRRCAAERRRARRRRTRRLRPRRGAPLPGCSRRTRRRFGGTRARPAALSRSCNADWPSPHPRAAESGTHSAVHAAAVPDLVLWVVVAVVTAGARAGTSGMTTAESHPSTRSGPSHFS